MDNEDLAGLRPLIEIMAVERAGETRASDVPDMVQEGLIAAWQASQRFPEKDPSYYRAAARYGVVSVLRGRPQTGATGRRGWQDAHDTSVPLIVTTENGEQDLATEPEDPAAEAAYDAVDIEGAIHQAVADLPDIDRIVVFARYWEDRGFADIARQVGRPAGTLSRRWALIVRPQLARRLEHLVA